MSHELIIVPAVKGPWGAGCVGARSICEDQVDTFEHLGVTIAIVADGAGGMGGGFEAACTAVSVIRAEVTHRDEPLTPVSLTAALIHADGVLERTSMCGESTGLVVAICDGMVFGASVGDSEAVLADAGVMTDLTANQRRKPLLGSGSAMPVSFDPVPFRGMLVAGTDGLFKYCPSKAMADILSDTDGEPVVGRLVSAVRLPSGELRDDVGIVVISP